MSEFTLRPQEEILRKVRQTKLVLVGYFSIGFFLALVPLRFISKYDLGSTASSAGRIWLYAMVVYFLYHVFLWYLNVYIITNQRLVLVHYASPLHKQVNDIPKDKIVNISYEKKGLMQALFDYGNVILLMQSLNQPAILKRVPKPSEAKDELWQLVGLVVE